LSSSLGGNKINRLALVLYSRTTHIILRIEAEGLCLIRDGASPIVNKTPTAQLSKTIKIKGKKKIDQTLAMCYKLIIKIIWRVFVFRNGVSK
jgi:hypothetical protein